jgi:aminopeptidase
MFAVGSCWQQHWIMRDIGATPRQARAEPRAAYRDELDCSRGVALHACATPQLEPFWTRHRRLGRSSTRAHHSEPSRALKKEPFIVTDVLEPGELQRYADAIVKASAGVTRGETLVVQGEPAHRELVVAIAEAGFRAGAHIVDAVYNDPLLLRARLTFGHAAALGAPNPWAKRRSHELVKPNAARIVITGESEHGYLDGIAPGRIAAEYVRSAAEDAIFRRAALDMRARWTKACWPTDYWAAKVYPELSIDKAKARLAQDLLSFCRLTVDDGEGSSGWLAHVRALARRGKTLTNRDFVAVELRGEGTTLDVGLARGSRWCGGQEKTPFGRRFAPNMPTEETFTSPHESGANGTFTCTRPLTVNGRVIDGLRGEFRNGRLTRLAARQPADRDFVANYIDSDPSGNGRRLGEIALVDATSRIAQSGRLYFNTMLDENASAHIALGAGLGCTRTTKPARNVNKSSIHLDIMIGSPDLDVFGIDVRGRRVCVIRDGRWRI